MLDSTSSGLHSGATPLLRTAGLTKRYGSFLANENIDIEIWPRQIHALLGENGAGKSTLVKTIYGLIQPSEGEMRWQGEKMVLSGPSEARGRGPPRGLKAPSSPPASASRPRWTGSSHRWL